MRAAFECRFSWYLLLLPLAWSLHTQEPQLPAGTPAAAARNAQVGWLTVRLHQFDASNTDTFEMRYYYNPAPATTNNIVIFVGGEWQISTGWVTAGLPYEHAQEIGAAVFYTEHRYYGLTRPTNDTSVENLQYLTVDQALGDLAQFIQYVRSEDFENGRYKDGSVSIFGCSYSGSMATWMRLAHPHLVHAAMSDSGPLHAQDDFPEYLEVIAEAIREQGGEECLSSVEESMKALVARLEQPGGAAEVSEMFNTCSPLNPSSPLDRATFFWYGVTEVFAYLVQYATPGDIPKACEVLTDPNVADPVSRLARWARPASCLETRYQEVVARHRDLSYDAYDSVMRLWTFQTCVEYGWYQTTSSARQPFLDVVPLDYFHQMCKDFFRTDFDRARIMYGASRTNLFFTDRTLPDRVVSVVGGHDPWSPVGPRAGDATDMAPVFVVPRTSHCQALRPTGSSEDPVLERTKRRVLDYMKHFATDAPLPATDAARHVRARAVFVAAVVVALMI